MKKKLFVFFVCGVIVFQVSGCKNVIKNENIKEKQSIVVSEEEKKKNGKQEVEVTPEVESENEKTSEQDQTNKSLETIPNDIQKTTENLQPEKIENTTKEQISNEDNNERKEEVEISKETKSEQVLGESQNIYSPSTMELEVLNYINEYRAQNGLSTLTYNVEIYECAKIRAEEALIVWSHTRPDGRKFWTVFNDCNKNVNNVAGENLANKFTDTKRIVDLLMNSESHRENILNSRFTSVGIAIIQNSDGRYCMAQLFMG